MNDKSKQDKKPQAVPRTNEQKAAKFKELAKARTGKVLKAIHNIGNLASANYVYTPEQVVKVCAALKGAVAQVEQRFTQPPKASKPEFDL